MGFFNVIKNEVKAAVGYQQNFTSLLEAKDISRALYVAIIHHATAYTVLISDTPPFRYSVFFLEVLNTFLYVRSFT